MFRYRFAMHSVGQEVQALNPGDKVGAHFVDGPGAKPTSEGASTARSEFSRHRCSLRQLSLELLFAVALQGHLRHSWRYSRGTKAAP